MKQESHSLTERLDQRARSDMLWTIGVTAVVLFFTWDIDAVEWFIEFTEAHEDWQLDEIITRLLLIGFGTMWYAVRRHMDMRTLNKEIEKLAFFDSLTDLPNREMAIDNLSKLIAKAKRNNKKAAVLFVDVDNFKLINDNYGHTTGDKLIEAVSQRLKIQLREEDTIARLSGDEFLILIDDLDDNKYAIYVAKRIMETMKEPIVVDDHEVIMTVSIGISTYPDDGIDSKELLREADIAMYHAKQAGKNCLRFYSEEMNLMLSGRLKAEKVLRDAIDNDGFKLVYQPQVESDTGKIGAVEALLRLNDSNVGPAEFIPVAEETGLILQIGDWVMQEACRQAMEWQRNGMQPIKMAVNVSSRQLQQHNFVSKVKQILKATGLEAEHLELEITESALAHDVESAAEKIRELNDIGVLFAIDDFGTGYSSLERLKQFNINKLKIDRGFVKDLENDKDDAIITKTIIGLAHNMGMVSVAEGVETQDQVNFLTEETCNKFQGYYFAKPLTANEIEDLVDSKPELDHLILANQKQTSTSQHLN